MPAEREKFLSLELARGLAAFLVLLFHIDRYYFNTPKYYPGPVLDGLFGFGHAGVEFFFVLSGFIMIWSHWRDLGVPGKVGPFIVKRVIRIYPLVWFCTLVLLGMYLAVPNSARSDYRDPLVVLQSLALVGTFPQISIDFPAWTLWHENVFYLFCALIIWRPRIGAGMLIAWGIVCASFSAQGTAMERHFYPLAPINLLFLFGVAVAAFLKRSRLPAPGLVCTLGIALFFGFGVVSNNHPFDEMIQHVVYGLGATAAIAGAVELERSDRIALPGWTATAGVLSYPLYLSHMFIAPVLAKALVALHLVTILPPIAGMAVIAGGACAAALLIHHLVERPATEFLRARWLPRRSPAVST